MQIAQLFRHPVKSVGGEQLTEVDVDARGMAADRWWALYTDDGGIASGKTSRRFRKVTGLLQWGAVLGASAPELVGPAGERIAVDAPDAPARLRAAFGVALTPRTESDVPHFDDAPLHLVTTSSLAAAAAAAGGGVMDARRSRANVVVDTGDEPGWVEDGWLGRELALGPDLVVRVTEPMPRCVMVDMTHRGAQEGPSVLKALGSHGVELGVMAEVVRPGRIAVGDAVTHIGA